MNGPSDMAHNTPPPPFTPPPPHTHTHINASILLSDLVATDSCHIYSRPADKRVEAGRLRSKHFRETLEWSDLHAAPKIPPNFKTTDGVANIREIPHVKADSFPQVLFLLDFSALPIRTSHLATCGHMWKTAHCPGRGLRL